ncbi:MAG: hypothetical protein ACYS8S_04585, partial [Planctomycetota bacterium]
LSRARYYQLVNSGFFPRPLIDERSNRPYYDAALQKVIMEARETGIGVDGSYLLFYSPRKSESHSHGKKKKQVDPITKELGEILESMGLKTAFEEVQKALDKLYPDGTEGIDQGLVTRELYRYFKQME